jgi:branched-subunit amino acid ABC-type transport system permease component
VNHLLPFIVAGLVTGSVYALAGVGLVVTYKTSGVFNFAYGGIATLGAYVFYVLHHQHGLAWPLAAVIVLLGGVLVGVAFETFGSRLAHVSTAWQIASTIGILISIQAVATLIWGSVTRTFPHFLPVSTFRLASVNVTYEQLIILCVSVIVTVGLYVSLRLTRIGVSMRAVVDEPDLLALAATNPRRVQRYAWIIGTTFAVLSGILLAPSVTLDPTTLTLLIVQAGR